MPPVTGDHTFQGGLYRDVNLSSSPIRCTSRGTAPGSRPQRWPTNSGSTSTVAIKTEVQNSRSVAVNATLKTDIVDKDGKVVATISSQQQIDAGKSVTFEQTTPAISNPSLWHPDHPTMYKALSYLSDSTGTVDTFTTPFGFRWSSWSATEGFSLNGAHYWIQGSNVHQDHAGWGIGISDSALYRDVKMVKDAGMNFIRGSHYPKAPALVDACDELGLLFWSENCFWGGFGGGPGGWSYSGAYPSTSADFDKFDANVLASLTDMIRMHRNHPSIIVWSMGNENFFNGAGPADRVIALLKKSVALTHELDPPPTGRPAAIGGAQSKLGGIEPGTLGDIAGYNGDGVGYDNPGVPNMVSEYGADVSWIRPGNYEPGWGNLTVSNGMPAQPAWRAGVCRWCMFDYGSQMGDRYTNTGLGRPLPYPEAGVLLASKQLRESSTADVAGPGHRSGIEAHVEYADSHGGGRYAGRMALGDGRRRQWQADQQQRSGYAYDQIGTRRIPYRPQHHLHSTGQRLRLGHRDPRRPSCHRIPHVLRRNDSHRGDLARANQLQRHHHLAGQPCVGRRNVTEGRAAAVSTVTGLEDAKLTWRARSRSSPGALAIPTALAGAVAETETRHRQSCSTHRIGREWP